jgi:hypothetical protein
VRINIGGVGPTIVRVSSLPSSAPLTISPPIEILRYMDYFQIKDNPLSEATIVAIRKALPPPTCFNIEIPLYSLQVVLCVSLVFERELCPPLPYP